MAHLPSYRRFRTPAVVALRLACFVRPFCYTREWVDAISPGPNPGRLGPLTDFLELCMASNVNLLVFSAVGLLLPFRLHLALHTLNAAVNAAFGLHPFCAGRLLSSAATAGRAQAFHRWAAVAATSLAPGSMRLVPQSERGQTAAFLLFLWATAGWLLPTLLLLPREQPTQSPPPSAAAPAAAAARQQGSKPPPSLLGGVESLLRLLRYGAGDTVACRAGTAIAGGEAPLRPLAWLQQHGIADVELSAALAALAADALAGMRSFMGQTCLRAYVRRVVGAVPLDQRAHEIFAYFSKYSYEVVERGEVITFEGRYAASVSQAAALVLYTLVGLASTALVLSISLPQVGNWWYAMCLVSPAAGTYYWKNAERTEQFKVKMVTSDDEQTTDIVVEGDDEEIERFWKEMGLMEKGKVLVKGILS
ncbi:CPLD51 required for cyt b6 assembly [Micractinium conductrix]|uniref:CPLD51 required for cyt b6 assembly n=1 Tax=Micractinium conductrix TaxID=554055 RepID=A0A2P6V267_9CHLO|nr:CPLD51 required for cyt b6 assembly [Micractinium conductrix]|eukprot:PSC68181.1 CPLD51 required for cyt b6 assembly [Micractinium conductrix]